MKQSFQSQWVQRREHLYRKEGKVCLIEDKNDDDDYDDAYNYNNDDDFYSNVNDG